MCQTIPSTVAAVILRAIFNRCPEEETQNWKSFVAVRGVDPDGWPRLQAYCYPCNRFAESAPMVGDSGSDTIYAAN
jgi:hypothetical protein